MSVQARLAASAAIALLLTLPAIAGAQANAAPPPVTLRVSASGFNAPTAIANANDGSGRLFVTEQAGTIRVVRDGVPGATPFLDLSGSVSIGGERGLLGLAFHPGYAANGRFFVFYTATDGALTISEFARHPTNVDQANAASQRVVLSITHPLGNHNGGQIAFGPDGYLYIGTGDGGGAGDSANNAQNLGVLLGKILRIDVDGAQPYAIPPTNPLVGTSGTQPEIWAYGLRNPWRFSFDRASGDLWLGDVGQNRYEEVDYVPYSPGYPPNTWGDDEPSTLNFGWRAWEGNACFDPSNSCHLVGQGTNLQFPVLVYGHDANGGNSITGGYVYRGVKSPLLRGWYLYGDFGSNRVWALRWQPNTGYVNYEVIAPGSLSAITTFGEGEDGELYVASAGNGTIYAIQAGPAAAVHRAFVASHGDDANVAANCNLSQPCRGFAAAQSVLLPGGEIVALDTADYGPINIAQSMSIVANPGFQAFITESPADAIVVSGPGDKVLLRGLSLNGGIGNGVNVTAAATVTIDNCVISNFNQSGVLVGASGARLTMSNTALIRNVSHGLSAGRAHVTRSRAIDNGGIGFVGGALSIVDSFASGNVHGFAAIGDAARLDATRVSGVGNSFSGLRVNGSGATAVVAGSMFSANGSVGMSNVNGGTLKSLGDNLVHLNGSSDTSGPITPLPGL